MADQRLGGVRIGRARQNTHSGAEMHKSGNDRGREANRRVTVMKATEI